MKSITETELRNIYAEATHGKNGHVDPLLALEAMTARIANTRIPGSPHTIIQLLSHLNYWQLRFVAMLKHETVLPTTSAHLGWHHQGECTEHQLHEQINIFANSLAFARENLLDPDFDMHRTYGHFNSAFALFQSMTSHVAYHTGEIVLLRRICGDWPPPSGGDTW